MTESNENVSSVFRQEFVQNLDEILSYQGYLKNGLSTILENSNQDSSNLNQTSNSAPASTLNTPKLKRRHLIHKSQQNITPQQLQHQLQQLDKLVKNKDKDGLKQYCRQGGWETDHPIRTKLWLQLTNFHRKSRSEHVLDAEYRDYSNIDTELAEKLPRKLPGFVDASFCRHFQLNPIGQIQLDRILWQVAVDHPEMTYCPLLYPITALFLHYLTSEETYSAVSNLVDAEIKSKSGRSQCLLPQTRSQIIKDAYVLLKLTNNFGLLKRKQFYEIQRSRLAKFYELDTCFLDWLKWIFIGLPFPHIVRIIDCYLIEGSKLLFRIGIAILILFKRHLDKRTSTINENAFFAQKFLRRFSNTQPDPGFELEINKVMTFCEQIKESPAELMEIAFGLARFSSYKIDNEYANAEASLKQNRSLANLSSTLNLGQLNSSMRARELVKPETIRISNRISPKSLANSTILNWQLLEILWEWLPDRLMVSEPVVLFNMTEHGNSLSTFYTRADQWEPTLLIVKTLKNEIFGAFCSTAWNQRLGSRNAAGNISSGGSGKNKYFGTGETFLFKLQPNVAFYPWIGSQDSVKLSNGFANQQKRKSSSNQNLTALTDAVSLDPTANQENINGSSNGNLNSLVNNNNLAQKAIPAHSQLFMCGERKYICVGSGGGNALWLDENLTRGRSERCSTFDNDPLVEKSDFICGNVELIGFK